MKVAALQAQTAENHFVDSEIPHLQMERKDEQEIEILSSSGWKWAPALALGSGKGSASPCTAAPAADFSADRIRAGKGKGRGLIDRKESSKWKWIIEEQTVIVEGDLINCFRARQGAKSQILCCHKSQKSEKNNKSYYFFFFPSQKILNRGYMREQSIGLI